MYVTQGILYLDQFVLVQVEMWGSKLKCPPAPENLTCSTEALSMIVVDVDCIENHIRQTQNNEVKETWF